MHVHCKVGNIFGEVVIQCCPIPNSARPGDDGFASDFYTNTH